MAAALGTDRPRRRRSPGAVAALLAVLAGAALLASCTQASPGVITAAPGRGRVAGGVVAPSEGCTSAGATGLPAGRSTVSLVVGGLSRTATLNVPESAAGRDATPSPLLLSLHPFLLGPDAWEAYSGLAAAAVARGYVVATPLGSDPGPRWTVPGGLASSTDDLAFIGALVDRIEDGGCVDRNREFAAGFSAGAAMAQALSCTMPGRFAGIAGSGGTNLTDLCPDSPGTDVLVLHGVADPIAPTTGSEVAVAPPIGLGVDRVVATDAARAGCDPVPSVTQLTPSVVDTTFRSCTSDRRVRYLSLIGAGHTWAGSPNPLLELVTGPTNTDISATATVLDFFDGTRRTDAG